MRSVRIGRVFLLAAAVLSCASAAARRAPVEVEMQNVDLHVTDDVTLHIKHLRGRFEPQGTRPAPILDDQTSYVVDLDSGVIAIDLPSLNALMTRALAGDASNVDHLTIGVDDTGRLKQKGVIDKGVGIPFSSTATVSATRDGKLLVHTTAVKGFGVSMRPLMKVFHIELDDLLEVKPGHGVTVRDNDLVLDPSTLLPPPTIRGVVTSASVQGQSVVQTFGDGKPRHLSPPATSPNFIYWRGGSLVFGKLTMTETDLELVDMDPKDPFDFSVEHWNDQLVAGYSKNTAARGLKAHIPDYNDLAAHRGR